MAITTGNIEGKHVRLVSDSIDATGFNASDAFDVLKWHAGSMQIVWSGHGADTTTFVLEGSNDGGTHWDAIAHTTQATGGDTGSCVLMFPEIIPVQMIRLKVSGPSSTTGATLTAHWVGKGRA